MQTRGRWLAARAEVDRMPTLLRVECGACRAVLQVRPELAGHAGALPQMRRTGDDSLDAGRGVGSCSLRRRATRSISQSPPPTPPPVPSARRRAARCHPAHRRAARRGQSQHAAGAGDGAGHDGRNCPPQEKRRARRLRNADRRRLRIEPPAKRQRALLPHRRHDRRRVDAGARTKWAACRKASGTRRAASA